MSPAIVQQKMMRVIDYHGTRLQKIVAIEEMSELTKEISKDLRDKGDRDHIAEEMADVLLMLDELAIIYNITYTELSAIKHAKLNRECHRISEWSQKV